MKRTIYTISLLLFALSGSLRAQDAQNSSESLSSYSAKGSLSVRTNFATWVALVPSLGLEYKASDHFGLLVDGAYSHWKLNTKNRYWHFWNVSPQVRYYTGEQKGSYLGGVFTVGEYNFTGSQGNYQGGGLSIGHQFYMAKNLMLDLGITAGYLHLYNREEYERIDGVDYRMESKGSTGYWGPIGASISLVWKIN